MKAKSTQSVSCTICEKDFNGNTAYTRYKAHCKTEHLEFYRKSIRPLKDPKLINRDAYLKRKQNNPGAIETQRTMARMWKKARMEQIREIQRQHPPEPPPVPEEPFIDENNPYYVASTEFGIFVGVTFADLLGSSIENTLKKYSLKSSGSLDSHLSRVLQRALIMLGEYPIETLAQRYHAYRTQLLAVENYPKQKAKYDKLLDNHNHKCQNPESYVDEDLVTACSTQLYADYMLKKNSAVDTCTGDAVPDDSASSDSESDGESGAVVEEAKAR
ncbi:hypothetical protein DFP73DRAFT_532337 [Morchella snyderi]|nr:hypothetical protein DFP73DRAFT_532337 [Morchella snyderi]